MQVDWITVAAQIVNFLVLVWLLQRFLYGPITRAMARRKQRIGARLQEADTKRAEAEAQAEEWRRKQADLDAARDDLMREARGEADALRARLEREAREEIDAERQAWRREVVEERAAFLHDLRLGAVRHVHDLARRALVDLADAGLEARVAERFMAALQGIGADRAEAIARAARGSGDGVRIESALALPASVKGRLTKAVQDVIADGLDVGYGIDEALMLGIRLRAGSQTLEWSMVSYLDHLEEAVAERLQAAAAGARDAA